MNDGTTMDAARGLWSGTTAVVTGAGSGLGSGFAEVAADLGMRVVVCDIDGRRAKQQASALAGRGAEAEAVVIDVRDFTAVQSLADEVCAAGDVGLLVNNAGVEHLGLLWEVTPEDWHRVVDVNLNGVFHGVRAFVPRMITQQRRSAVLNISSVGALTTGAYHGTYEVTKHAVLALAHFHDLEFPHRSLPGGDRLELQIRVIGKSRPEEASDVALLVVLENRRDIAPLFCRDRGSALFGPLDLAP